MRRGPSSRGRFAAALALTAVLPYGAAAANGQGWTLTGSNEVTVDHYDVTGDETRSPYPFEGMFWTNRTRFVLGYADVDGRLFDLDLELLAGDDAYLAEDGLVLERLRLGFEHGGWAVPVRLGAGDVFVELSRRTLQREIRGLSFELQPPWRGNHSLLVVLGSGVPQWSELDDRGDDLTYSGASYLFATRQGGTSLVANLVSARQEPGTAGAFPLPDAERDELVGSVYGETSWGTLRLEGEVAHLETEQGGEEGSDTSFYAQLSSEGALAWRMRVEQNGEAYRPIGSVGVLADRRTGELDARRSWGRAGSLRGHLRRVIEGWDGEREDVTTDALGLIYDARPLARRGTLRLRLSGDFEEAEAETGAFERSFLALRLGLEDRISPRWGLRYRGSYKDLEGSGTFVLSRRLQEHELAVQRRLHLEPAEIPLRGQLGLGLGYREQSGGGGHRSWRPFVDLALTSPRHSLRLHLGFDDQELEAPMTIEELRYHSQALAYRYSRGRHQVGLEVARELRRPRPGAETDSRRITLRYRVDLRRGETQ